MIVLAVAASCSTPGSSPGSSPSTSRTRPPTPGASCAWYTPTSPPGQTVIITTTGTSCGTSPVIDFAAVKTRRIWYSAGLGFGDGATLIAQLARHGVTVRIFQSGSSAATMSTAGQLAGDFRAAGWTPQVPTGARYSTALA